MDELRDVLLQVRNRLSSSSRQDQFLEMILSAEESLGLLGTNDDPIRTEELLRAPLNQCQTLLRQKRQEKADLHCPSGVLEEEERDLVNITEKIKRLFSYIQRCPPEIIREIFLNCVDFYHAADNPYRFYSDGGVGVRIDGLINLNKAPLLLFRVSKEWRRIALDTPKLFTNLYLPFGLIEGGEEKLKSVLHLFLTCSGSLALDIFLRAHWRQPFSYRRVEMVSEQLSPCFSRVCRIRVPMEFLCRLFPPGSCTDAPALLEFQIYGHSLRTQLGKLVAPKLEVFTSLKGFNWDGFITFGKYLKIFSSGCAWVKLQQLFQDASNMEYCHILHQLGWPPLQLECVTPIFLPQLRDLSICTLSQICPLLRQLRMPSLCTLDVEIQGYDPNQESILGGIISSFTSARPSLEKLLIRGTLIQREEFHNLLCILPELTTISLHNCEILDALHVLLPAYAPDICPKLHTLNLTDSYHPGYSQADHKQYIVDIICSRARSRLSEDPEERTQRCLRHIFLGAAGFSDVALNKFRSLGDEYDVDIALEGCENGCKHLDSPCNCPRRVTLPLFGYFLG